MSCLPARSRARPSAPVTNRNGCFTQLARCSSEEIPMTTKLIVIYDQPEDAEAFFKHYEEVHMPLVKRTPGLQRLVLNRVVGDVFGGSAPYLAIAEMDYPDRETFDAAMKSSTNQSAAKPLLTSAIRTSQR